MGAGPTFGASWRRSFALIAITQNATQFKHLVNINIEVRGQSLEHKLRLVRWPLPGEGCARLRSDGVAMDCSGKQDREREAEGRLLQAVQVPGFWFYE